MPKKNQSGMEVKPVDSQDPKKQPLTSLEKLARKTNKQNIRFASYMPDSGGMSGANVKTGASNFYSPQLSTDFLELPQSEREKRELFRFWYNCFVPGTPVTLLDGTTKPIELMEVGDSVPNGYGEPTVVVQTYKHEIDDQIYRMKVRGVQHPIRATGNHPFLVFRSSAVNCKYTSEIGACKQGSNSICKRTKCQGMDFGKPEFVELKDLKVGDFIVSPAVNPPERNALTLGQMRLLGYYASEGSIAYRKKDQVRGVEFSLNIDEFDTIAQEICNIYRNEFGGSARRYKQVGRNTCHVICDGLPFADFCSKHIGKGSHNKRFSDEVMSSSPDLIKEFLGAYWNGDGCFTDNSYTANTVSYDMASQIQILLRRIGYPSYHSHYVAKGGYQPQNGPSVVNYISFPGRYHPEFSKYANFVSGEYTAKSSRVYLVNSDYGYLHRVNSIDPEQYSGYVYNIEVEGEGDKKSYIAHGLSTHNTHPIIASAIDFHTDVPMSKIRLSLPKGKDLRRNKQIHHFFLEMVNRVRLFNVLYDMTHEYWLHGNVFPFVEDHDLTDSIPEHLLGIIKEEHEEEPDYQGIKKKKIVTKPNPVSETERSKKIREWVAENYQGWQRIQILPPEQIKLEVFQYTHRVKMELIPSEKDRMVVMKAADGMDDEAMRIAEDIPDMIKNSLLSGEPIPLNSSPYDDFLCSSFCYHLAHKKSAYDDRGISLLERCLRTLLVQDKLRQAQTSIASRAMTPKRVIWADKMSEIDTDLLRDQVEQALQDPDFSMVTNFEVHWDEIGARDRLLDLTSEYENTNKMLYIGLRITESMLTGESTYSGERIHLDVMNTMYLLYRERIAEFVEEYLFKPVAEKKGFWEEDEYGNRVLLYPKLQFTRLALRDNSELQDYMFNLYQKGSLPISFILDLINIDPDDAVEQLKLDALTFNDPNFNEFLKRALEKAGDESTEKTNILEIIFKNAGLKYSEKQGDRFGKDEE